jgi:Fur family ferric uptake transcriptional regulator
MSHTTWDYAALMRERGFRVTPQRQIILDAVCESGGHTTPEQIYERVHSKTPALNRATIYRNLDFLCEMRLVVAVRIGDQTYYEIAGDKPHHHLICRTCGKSEQIGHEAVEAFFGKIERDHDFTIDMDHVGLFGLCARCRRASSRK